MYYRNAQSALVVYDITKPTSLIKARHWVAELQRQASPGIVIALVGNKVDLTQGEEGAEGGGSGGGGGGEDDDRTARTGEEDEGTSGSGEGGATATGEVVAEGTARKVTTKEARDYAEEEGLLFFETSAKTGLNVQEVFTAIANAIPETQMKGSRAATGGGGGGGAAGGARSGAGTERVNLAGPRDAGPKEGCAC